MNRLLNDEHNQLATLCYVAAMRERIEKEQREKYAKRIDYLVGANNELMRALEKTKGNIDFDFTAKGERVVARLDSVTEKKRES